MVYEIVVEVLFSIEKVVEVGRCLDVLSWERCSLYRRDMSLDWDGSAERLLRVDQFVL